MAVDVCYVISHGFAARMVLHSRLLHEVQKRGLTVAVLLPGIDKKTIGDLESEYGIQVATVPHRGNRKLQLSARIKPYVYEDVRANPALWAKHLRVVKGVDGGGWWRFGARGFFVINRIAVRSAGLRNFLLRAEQRSLRSRQITSILESMSPKLVVSTYPVNDFEASAIIAAQEARILTVGHLLSWDNITSKGRFIAIPDRFVAWGPIMAEELLSHYGVGPDRVIETGVAHFDSHVSDVSAESMKRYVSALRLDPAKPYLFFGMSSPVFSPTEIEIVEWVAARVEDGVWGEDMQLVVRPHPQNVEGAMADTSWLPRLEALRSVRVAVDYPILRDSELPWDVDRSDLLKLVNLLGGSRVCLNSGSTLSIDAVVQDRPVVVTLFDAEPDLPWWASASRLGSYTHQRKLLELGGVRVARSFEDLEAALKAYLENPTLDADGRARVRKRELGSCDGRATERVADALARFVTDQIRVNELPNA